MSYQFIIRPLLWATNNEQEDSTLLFAIARPTEITKAVYTITPKSVGALRAGRETSGFQDRRLDLERVRTHFAIGLTS